MQLGTSRAAASGVGKWLRQEPPRTRCRGLTACHARLPRRDPRTGSVCSRARDHGLPRLNPDPRAAGGGRFDPGSVAASLAGSPLPVQGESAAVRGPTPDCRRRSGAGAPVRAITGSRHVGTEVWKAVGVSSPIQPIFPSRQPPCATSNGVTFRLDIGPGLPPRAASSYSDEAEGSHSPPERPPTMRQVGMDGRRGRWRSRQRGR